MATVYLVRHGVHALVDRVLCGRSDPVGLSAEGVAQAQQLADTFAYADVTQVATSPRRRACETAAPIAVRLGLPLEQNEAIDELDVGEWTGCSFVSLAGEPLWQHWNSERGSGRPPRGESMQELRARVVAHLEHLLGTKTVAVLVTHAEPIRAALLHYRDIALDRFDEIEVAPGSISVLRECGGRFVVARTNVAALP
jgi:broad specificity phosphatase PhoE